MSLVTHLKSFLTEIKNDKIEIYNEASVQYELTIYLRQRIQDKYKIQLERNIEYFGLKKKHFLKKEMDIVVFTQKMRTCIELKFPRNGEYPEQMFSACKDIKFLEQLRDAGFKQSYFLMLANDPLFYSNGREEKPLYKIFRKEGALRGLIKKPTGNKDEKLKFNKEYRIKWIELSGKLKYVLVSI